MAKYKRIKFEDDIVVVYHRGKAIYKGMEDYEPMKYEPWVWNEKQMCYKLDGGYKKFCLNV